MNASLKEPRSSASIERVTPQPGHGTPVQFRMRQIVVSPGPKERSQSALATATMSPPSQTPSAVGKLEPPEA